MTSRILPGRPAVFGLALAQLFCFTIASADPVIEEITVTATKREASIQDVPVAVTALSGSDLDDAGVQDLRDLSIVAASFNMNSFNTENQGSTLRIRGVGTSGNNTGLESAVGVFVDGIYLSRPGVALGDLMDLEAVEVLRGPQGTLFGRNTSAGALNIRTKAPSFDDPEFFINLTAGNYDARNIQIGGGGALSDTLAYRIAAAVRDQDGFLESATGAESRTRDRYLIRGQILWEPSDQLSIRLIADYSEADEACCDAVVIQESPAAMFGSFAAAGLPANGGIVHFGDNALKDRRSKRRTVRYGL